MDELGIDSIDSALLLKQAQRQVKVTNDQVVALQHRYAKSLQDDDAEPDEPDDTYSRALVIEAEIGAAWRADYKSKDFHWNYNGRHWQQCQGNDYAESAIEKVYDLKGWRQREKHVVASDLAGFRRRIKRGVPGSATGLVPFANGIVRLSDMTLHPHSPDFGNTYCLPYEWLGIDSPCDKFDEFLNDRLGDSDTVTMFLAACNVALTGSKFKGFLEITGASDSGKSVVVASLEALVGIENRASGSLAKLESPLSRFETIRYSGMRLAIFPESQAYSGSLEVTKAMTGRDTIPAEIKGVNGSINYVFDGLFVITGNRPIRASEASGAVFNRRRSIPINTVIPLAQQRPMLELENGKWVGGLAEQLPGLAAKVLLIPPDVVRQALQRNVRSLKRVQANLHSLLESDPLARWANERLVWDARIAYSRIGKIEANPGDGQGWLLANYRKWIEEHENCKGYGQNAFKAKLISLLRDSLGVPLPPHGDPAYSDRLKGSLIPHIRLRDKDADANTKGIIEWASLRQVGRLVGQEGADESPVSDGRDECDEKKPIAVKDENHPPQTTLKRKGRGVPPKGRQRPRQSITSIPPITNRLSQGAIDFSGSSKVGSGADVLNSDGDDPHWGPRPTTNGKEVG